MNAKKKIGRMIPYPIIELGRRAMNLGFGECRVCGSRVRRYKDTGYGFAVLERLQVVGGLRRAADSCPVCHSSSRERLIWFWLSQKGRGFRFAADCSIAHFAPEKGLASRLRAAVPAGYAAYDLDPARYRHLSGVLQADLCRLPMSDVSVDLLLCNHVLEHVPDVASSLAEIFRVLVPGGVAILQVPISLKIDKTIELGVDSAPEERARLLGQDDHLRLFSEADYLAALRSAGFEAIPYDAFEDDDQAATEWRLDPFEKLYLCEKPAAR